jgi:hypothetical protein
MDEVTPGSLRPPGDSIGPNIPLAADGRSAATPERAGDRLPSALAAQASVPSAANAGQPVPHGSVPESVVAQTPRADGSGRDTRGVSIRGQDDARLAAPTTASGPANAAPPPVMAGRGADSLPGHVMSALHSGGGTGDAPERGREVDGPLGLEHRGSSVNGTTVTGLATPARAEMAQSAAMQIAAAIQKGGPGGKPGIELTLSPQELGRVLLTFTQSETGMVVNVHADRAETLELLRRNIDMLAQEFRDIGYESAQFTFDRDTGGDDTASPSGTLGAADTGARPAEETARPTTHLVVLSDRLDIRL